MYMWTLKTDTTETNRRHARHRHPPQQKTPRRATTDSHHRHPPQIPITDSHHREPPQTAITDSHHKQPPQTATWDSYHRQPSQTATTDSHLKQLPQRAITDSHHKQPPQTATWDSYHRQPPQILIITTEKTNLQTNYWTTGLTYLVFISHIIIVHAQHLNHKKRHTSPLHLCLKSSKTLGQFLRHIWEYLIRVLEFWWLPVLWLNPAPMQHYW